MRHEPKGLGTSVVNWLELIWATDLPAEAKLLAAYFRSFMNDKQDVAWPGLKRIAKETSMSEDRVKKYRKLLISEGWILIQIGGAGPKDTNKYWANIPEIAKEEIAKQLTSKGGQIKGGQIATPSKLRGVNLSAKGGQITPPNIQENIQVKTTSVPFKKIQDLYNQILPEFKTCVVLDDQRKRQISARWKSDERHQTIEFWTDYFEGQRTLESFAHRSGVNDRGWVADIEFMTRPKTFIGNIESLVSKK